MSSMLTLQDLPKGRCPYICPTKHSVLLSEMTAEPQIHCILEVVEATMSYGTPRGPRCRRRLSGAF